MVLIAPGFAPDISLVSEDLYCVLSETDTLGYIHKIGSLYVALSGDNIGHAVEVGQTRSWDRAVELVVSY
jgi:hypothetical protein